MLNWTASDLFQETGSIGQDGSLQRILYQVRLIILWMDKPMKAYCKSKDKVKL